MLVFNFLFDVTWVDLTNQDPLFFRLTRSMRAWKSWSVSLMTPKMKCREPTPRSERCSAISKTLWSKANRCNGKWRNCATKSGRSRECRKCSLHRLIVINAYHVQTWRNWLQEYQVLPLSSSNGSSGWARCRWWWCWFVIQCWQCWVLNSSFLVLVLDSLEFFELFWERKREIDVKNHQKK